MEDRVSGHQLIVERSFPRTPGGMTRIAECLWCAALAWGVFAFGTVYAWGYWPLAAVCGAAGLVRLGARGPFRLADGTRGFAVVLAVVAAAALAQVVPLPIDVLQRLNPQRTALLDQLDVRIA